MSKFFLSSALAIGLGLAPAMVAQTPDSVKEAQQTLKDKGFDPGPIDGIDGPRTRAATRQYHKQQSLTANGKKGPETLDSLGVKKGPAKTDFREAGSAMKNGYGNGGKQVGEGGKALGSDIKHGEVVDGAKQFGKDVGHGVAKMGKGTGHAAVDAAKGVKNTVTGK